MSRRRRLAAGFVLATAAFALFLTAVGPRAVMAELSTANLWILSIGFLGVLAALGCWSEAVRRLLASAGHPVGGMRYRSAYLSGEFLKQVIPMGQSGGPVLMSYTVSAETDAPHESTLAAATVFAFLNVVASLVLAVAALALLTVTNRGPDGALFRTVLVVMTAITGAILAVTLVTVYRRPALEAALCRLAGAFRGSVGRLSARLQIALDPERVRETVEEFGDVVDRLAKDRRGVATAIVLCVVGWLFFLLPLYTSFLALGTSIPFALVVFAVPVVTLLNVVPLPGGLGGFEVALAAVVAGLSTADLATATAAVLLFRLSNYWFIVLVGGLAAASLSVRVSDPPPIVPAEEPERG